MLDQAAKWLTVTAFAPGQSRPLLGSLVSLTYVQNTGAAFGLLKGQQLLFIVLSMVVGFWMVTLLRDRGLSAVARWGCALVLGGAIGNLIDRLRLGYVIDFLDLHVWPVFNIGDSAITIGVCLLLWTSLMHADRDADTR